MTDDVKRYYRQARKAGWRAAGAVRAARIVAEWDKAESAGLVRLDTEPDEWYSWEDAAGDCYEPECYPHAPGGRRAVEAQAKAAKEQFERDGAAVVVGEYDSAYANDGRGRRECWEVGASLGGCFGYADPLDWRENDCVVDIMRETLDAAYDAALAPRRKLLATVGCEPGEQLPAFAWPGGYPILYLAADAGTLCPDCANGQNGSDAADPLAQDDRRWRLESYYVHHEGCAAVCDHCGASIESAYGDPDAVELTN